MMGKSRRRILDLYASPTSPSTDNTEATTPSIAPTKFFPSDASATTTSPSTDDDESSSRVSYLSVTFRKKAAGTRLGIKVNTNERGQLIVGEMNDIGILNRSVLREGDEFYSVNGKKCQNMREIELVDMLREATGQVTIIVRNRLGVQNLAECMVEKINPNDIGITFMDGKTRNSKDGKNRNAKEPENLVIKSVDSKGIFANSLLSSGDCVVSVNGTKFMKSDGDVATDSMRKSLRFVTILAEVKEKATNVSNRRLRPSSSPGGNTEVFLSSPTSTTSESTVTLEKILV